MTIHIHAINIIIMAFLQKADAVELLGTSGGLAERNGSCPLVWQWRHLTHEVVVVVVVVVVVFCDFVGK